MRLIKFIALFTLSILLGACGGGGSSGTITTPVPGGSVTTTLSIDKTSLDPSVSETTTVTAVFTDNGRPLNGMPVQFSATPGYVSFNPLDGKVITDQSGKATIVMQAASNPPAEGVAQLTVSAVINGSNVTQTSPFYVNRAALKLATPVVQAAQSKMTAGSSTTISVQVLDANGVPYATPSGVDIYFSAERGNFIADNMVGKVRTNSAGVALVTYIAPYSTSTQVVDTITATLGSSVVRSTITIDPRQASNIQYASSVPAKTTFGYNQPITVSYRVSDLQGTALPNVPVTFSISGSPAGSTIIPTTVSDAYGYASTTLTTGSTQTMLWITAKLADGTSAQSAVFSVTPSGLMLSLTPITPAAATTIGSAANLPVSFKVVDASGNAVAGQVVDLSVIDSLGASSVAATLQQTSLTTNAQGVVSTTLVSKTTAASLWVKAQLQSSSTVFATSGMITVQSSTEGSIDLTLSSLTPNAGDMIMAMVKFTSLSPPPYSTSTQVIIKSDNSGVISDGYGYIDSQGNAFIPLYVRGAGRANIYAQIGNSLSPMNILTATASSTGGGGSLALDISPSSGSPGDYITATVQYSTPTSQNLSGQPVTIVSNYPNLLSVQQATATDSTGKAVVILKVANTVPQSTTVSLYATGAGTVSATKTLTLQASSQPILTADHLELVSPLTAGAPIAYGGTQTVSFKVVDVTGLIPVAGQVVNFKMYNPPGVEVLPADAYLSTQTASSDANGMVTATMNFKSKSMQVYVLAKLASGDIAPVQSPIFTVSGGAITTLTLSPSVLSVPSWTGNLPGTIGSLVNVGGVSSSLITAVLTDASGTAVQDGTLISFTTTGGSFAGANSCTTVAGKCSVTWQNSSPLPANGRADITATSGTKTATERIIMASVQPNIPAINCPLTAAVSDTVPSDTVCNISVGDLLSNTMAGGTKVTFSAQSQYAPSADGGQNTYIRIPTDDTYIFADSNATSLTVIPVVIRTNLTAAQAASGTTVGNFQIRVTSGGVISSTSFPLVMR